MLKKFNDYPYKNEPTFGNKFLLVIREKYIKISITSIFLIFK